MGSRPLTLQMFTLCKVGKQEVRSMQITVAENPHHFTPNIKHRCRPRDFREEKMQRLRLNASANLVADYFRQWRRLQVR